jgi:hypothetical protein
MDLVLESLFFNRYQDLLIYITLRIYLSFLNLIKKSSIRNLLAYFIYKKLLFKIATLMFYILPSYDNISLNP